MHSLLASLFRREAARGNAEASIDGTAALPRPRPLHDTAPLDETASLHLLVVDDDPGIRRLIEDILEDEGYDVETATNGAEALEVVDQMEDAPDAIVLDLEMPVMDGRTCYRLLRERGVTSPVVIVSAHDAYRARHQLGADAALEKPFDPDTLVVRIEHIAGHPDA